jgi:cation diffusion facilitator CzcD-associated flavoprotein CzcO
METVRARVDAVVKDSATAEALKPWYKQLCKRPCFHDEYLETFNLPSVKLVDTGGKGVERVTPHGVVVCNVEYAVDCLIYASGFEISTSFTSRMGFDVLGRGGVSLNDQWNANPETLHGVLTCGFPNLLVFSTTQGGQGINYVHVLADLGEHVAYIVSRCKRLGIETIEPSRTVAKEWWNVVLSSFLALAEYQADCTPGYYNNEGSRDPSGIKKVPFMGNATEFGQILKRWRDSDDFAGLEVTCVKTAPA